jgi:hypothetical protein
MRVTSRVSLSGISVIKLSLILVVALPLSNLSIAFSAAACQSKETGFDAASAKTERALAFPVVLKPGKRYLEDSAGRPSLIHGMPLGLIAQLTARRSTNVSAFGPAAFLGRRCMDSMPAYDPKQPAAATHQHGVQCQPIGSEPADLRC